MDNDVITREIVYVGVCCVVFVCECDCECKVRMRGDMRVFEYESVSVRV